MNWYILAALCVCLAWLPLGVSAQGFSALARVNAERSGIIDMRGGVELRLALSQGVPYRIFTLETPYRAVIEFNEVDWTGLDGRFDASEIANARVTGPSGGWSRLILTLDRPLAVSSAKLEADLDSVRLTVRFDPIGADAFAKTAGLPGNEAWAGLVPQLLEPAKTRQTGERLVVALDPGHGGIDGGATGHGIEEADLTLQMARELRDLLRQLAHVDVVLTRDADVFVPLPDRMSRARAAGADVFLSLHADSLAKGNGYAEGASVYALSERDGERASSVLTEREDRNDLLAGVELAGADDEVASILLDLARRETAPRSEKLSRALIKGLAAEGARLNSNPTRSAHFAVLRSADIPSVLVEVGFLSSERDRAELLSREGRKRLALGLARGLMGWALEDAADAQLLRR
ncbi:MAG: N-acetylmuramoyl-L-alanine amidase [Pseudomonadota bacterium]